MFQLSLLSREIIVLRRIVAATLLPIMIFYMTSLNFLVAGLMTAKAEDVTAATVVTTDPAPAASEVIKDAPKVETPVVSTSVPETPVVATPPVTIEKPVVLTPVPETPKVEMPAATVAPTETQVAPAQNEPILTPTPTDKTLPQWNNDGNKATTNVVVALGKTYVAPQNDQVTVTFTKLPKDAGKLSIEEITLSDEQVATLHALSNKAYDITSDMADGTFTYMMTLPKPKDQSDVEIKFAENVAGLEKAETVPEGDVKVKDNKIDAKLDHFTLFLIVEKSSSLIVWFNNIKLWFEQTMSLPAGYGYGYGCDDNGDNCKLQAPLDMPIASIYGGVYPETVSVELNSTDSSLNPEIRYTTDGSKPNEKSSLYAGPIEVSKSMTLKAIEMKEGFEKSSTMKETYNITNGRTVSLNPTFPIDILSQDIAAGYISMDGTSPATANKATFNLDYTLESSNATVTIPSGTEISKKDGGVFDMTALTAQDLTFQVNSSLAGYDSAGVIRLGIEGTALSFSKPLTISMYIGYNFNGRTLNVFSQNEWATDWQTQQLNGQNQTCAVINGLCTFQTDHATLFSVGELAPGTPSAPSGPIVISQAQINGIIAPVTGATLTSSIADTDQYSAKIYWNNGSSIFAPDTVYTATIVIIPKDGYTQSGVSENFFTVAGATTTNAPNSSIVMVTFPATAAALISQAQINGIVAPSTGANPTAFIADTDQYSATIVWNGNPTKFASSTAYIAIISLTPKTGYTLDGIAENFFTVAGAITTNAAGSGVVTAVFPATAAVDHQTSTAFLMTYEDLGFTTNSLKFQPGDTIYFKTESSLSVNKYYRFAILSPEGTWSYISTCTAGSVDPQKGSYTLADSATQGSGWKVEINEFISADCLGESNSHAVDFLIKDESGPIVTSFSATPTTINTDLPSSRTVAATFTVSDPSGVNIDNSDCQLISTNKTAYQRYNGAIASTGKKDQYTCIFNFESLSAQGEWDFNLFFQDRSGNGSAYGSGERVQEGIINLNEVPGAKGIVIQNMSTFDLGNIAPPALTEFSVDKAEVNTSTSSDTITANITITSQNGIYLDEKGDGAICELHSDKNSQYVWGVLRAVPGEVNNYTCTVVLPAFSATGAWYFGINDISDNFGHYVSYRYDPNYKYDNGVISGINAVLPNATAKVTNIAPAESADKTGPVLTEFSATPTTVDTSNAAQTITATFKVSDPVGVNDDGVSCNLGSNTTGQNYQGGIYNNIVTKNGDQYTCKFTLPVGSAKGDWYFRLSFADSFWNNSYYDARYLNGYPFGFDSNTKSWPASHDGAVINNDAKISDETGPKLNSFSVTPTTVNTDNHSRKITAVFETSEPLGRYYENSCELLGNSQYAIPTLVTKIAENKYICEATLPTNSSGGRWKFYLYIQDILGNNSSYVPFFDIPFVSPGPGMAYITNIGTSTVKQVMAGGGTTNVNADTSEALVSSSNQSATVVSVAAGVENATVNVSSLIGDNGTGLLPQISISSDSAQVLIPNQTTITSKDLNWNGIISAPVALNVKDVTVPGALSVDAAIEVGSINTNLSFDRAVRILLPGQAGKRTGFKQVGGEFTEIANICAADSQNSGDLARKNGGCKIDVGNDLVIWTSHFSQYAAYVQALPVDTTPPVITINNPNPIDITYGSSYVDAGATATDNVDPSVAVNASGTVDTNMVGTYTITYNATDAAGNVATPVTRTVNVVKANQAITFDALSGKTYGGVDFTVSASASSGLTVVFSTSGNCSSIDNAIHITGAGSCTVTAHQAGNANYNGASDVSQSFTIEQKAATVVAEAKTKTYGDVNPELTAVVAGIINGDALNYTLGTTATQFSNVGTPAIVVTLGSNPNYAVTPTNSTLTIEQKALTIAADDISKTYGAVDPTLTASYAGFVNGENELALDTPVRLTREAGETVGAYRITAFDATDVNYDIAYAADGTFTIGQTAPDGDGNATVNAGNPQVVLTDQNQNVTVEVASGTQDPTIDVSALLTGGTGTLPQITINSDVADVVIPDGTKVTGPASWDGIISAPTAGTPNGGKAPAGFAVGGTVITLGSPNGTITFDTPVIITLPGVTGAVGYRPAGSNQWMEITNICTGTYDSPTGAPVCGECTISNGTDTKILTYHFTSFGELLDTLAPDTVKNLGAKYRPETQDVKVSWDAKDKSIEKVYIYRGTKKNFVKDSGSRVSKQNRQEEVYKDSDVEIGKTYFYKVVTEDAAGNQSASKVIKITIPTGNRVAVGVLQGTEPASKDKAASENSNNDSVVKTTEASGGSNDTGSVLGETTDQENGNQSGFWASNWKWLLVIILAGAGIFVWRKRKSGSIVQ